MPHQFTAVQMIPASPEVVWNFFSNPANLRSITPPEMGLVTITRFDKEFIYKGQLIEYTVRPLFGIRMHWITEIVAVDAPFYFVDQQLKGPFAVWHHQHFFKAVEGGVEMTDIVDYRLPLGWIGNIFAGMIHKRVRIIFNFRRAAIERVFGKYP
jgi:ligand-binding SRPBCC domain-containing protein